jgi:GDSL-like Lipase/Acylhydrolase family
MKMNARGRVAAVAPGAAAPRSLRGLLVLLTILPLCAATSAPSLAQAASGGSSYVALGDSYSSGEGLGDYETQDLNTCDRSSHAYPHQVLPQVTSRAYWACSGARTWDMDPRIPTPSGITANTQYEQPWQAKTVGSSTTYMSLTAGGDDADFAAIGKACAELVHGKSVVRFTSMSCAAELNIASASLTTLAPHLETLYTDLLNASSSTSELVVLGYPRVLPPTYDNLPVELGHPFCVLDHYPLVGDVGMPVSEAIDIDSFERGLNATIQQAVHAVATQPGFAGRIAYADSYDVSIPHNCRGTTPNATVAAVELSPGANGIGPGNVVSTATFHPTTAGSALLAKVVNQTFAQLAQRTLLWQEASLSPQPFAVGPIVCPDVGDCTTIAMYGSSNSTYEPYALDSPYALTLHDGSWTRTPLTEPPPADAYFNFPYQDIACPAISECVAPGQDETATSGSHLVMAIEHDGAWNTATLAAPPNPPYPNLSPAGVWGPLSCPAVSACVATAEFNSEGNPPAAEAAYMQQPDGTWSSSWLPIPSTPEATSELTDYYDNTPGGLFGLACFTDRTCTAVGTYSPDENNYYETAGVIWHYNNGTWSTETAPTGIGYNLTLGVLACGDPHSCVATGYTDSPLEGFLLEELDGSWTEQPLPPPAGTTAAFADPACSGPRKCTLLMSANLPTTSLYSVDDYYVLQDEAGVLSSATRIPQPSGSTPDSLIFQGLVCSSQSWCAAAGDYSKPGDQYATSHGLLMTDADGVVSVSPDPISFNAIGFYQPLSCPAPGQCALSSEDGERIAFTGRDWGPLGTAIDTITGSTGPTVSAGSTLLGEAGASEPITPLSGEAPTTPSPERGAGSCAERPAKHGRSSTKRRSPRRTVRRVSRHRPLRPRRTKRRGSNLPGARSSRAPQQAVNSCARASVTLRAIATRDEREHQRPTPPDGVPVK